MSDPFKNDMIKCYEGVSSSYPENSSFARKLFSAIIARDNDRMNGVDYATANALFVKNIMSEKCPPEFLSCLTSKLANHPIAVLAEEK